MQRNIATEFSRSNVDSGHFGACKRPRQNSLAGPFCTSKSKPLLSDLTNGSSLAVLHQFDSGETVLLVVVPLAAIGDNSTVSCFEVPPPLIDVASVNKFLLLPIFVKHV